MLTLVQLAGAGLVLPAFILGQRGLLAPTSSPSPWLNTVGAGVLAAPAPVSDRGCVTSQARAPGF